MCVCVCVCVCEERIAYCTIYVQDGCSMGLCSVNQKIYPAKGTKKIYVLPGTELSLTMKVIRVERIVTLSV